MFLVGVSVRSNEDLSFLFFDVIGRFKCLWVLVRRDREREYVCMEFSERLC